MSGAERSPGTLATRPAPQEPGNFARECYTTYTNGMPGDTGKEPKEPQLLPIFEPMPQEALDRLRVDFPQDEPLNPEQRRETVAWLLMPHAEGGGGVSVRLLPPYNDERIQAQLVEGLLLNSWFLPDPTLGNNLTLRGESGHQAGSTTVPVTIIEDGTRKVDVVVKPFNSKNSKAENELNKLRDVKERGISTVEPFGKLDVTDSLGHETFILTTIRKGLVPIRATHLEHLEPKELKSTLENLGVFVANMHNQGMIHHDLHSGNIAIDNSQSTGDQFVVFDLEKAEVMPKDKLAFKNKVAMKPPESLMRKFVAFEKGYINDIATLAADIKAKNEYVAYDTIFYSLLQSYLRQRALVLSHGQLTDETFIAAFDAKYKKVYRRVKAYLRWSREHDSQLQTNSRDSSRNSA